VFGSIHSTSEVFITALRFLKTFLSSKTYKHVTRAFGFLVISCLRFSIIPPNRTDFGDFFGEFDGVEAGEY
jgi:hypothetical protein